jgi:hypothetical protein
MMANIPQGYISPLFQIEGQPVTTTGTLPISNFVCLAPDASALLAWSTKPGLPVVYRASWACSSEKPCQKWQVELSQLNYQQNAATDPNLLLSELSKARALLDAGKPINYLNSREDRGFFLPSVEDGKKGNTFVKIDWVTGINEPEIVPDPGEKILPRDNKPALWSNGCTAGFQVSGYDSELCILDNRNDKERNKLSPVVVLFRFVNPEKGDSPIAYTTFKSASLVAASVHGGYLWLRTANGEVRRLSLGYDGLRATAMSVAKEPVQKELDSYFPFCATHPCGSWIQQNWRPPSN